MTVTPSYRTTEDGDRRVTEGGDAILLEPQEYAASDTGTLSFSGSFTTGYFIPSLITATLSFAGAASSLISRQFALTAALFFSGNVIRGSRKSIAAALSFSGKILRQLPSLFTATLNFIGNLTAVKPVHVVLSGTLSFIGNLVSRRGRIFTATLSFSGKINKAIGHSFTAVLSSSGFLTRPQSKFFTASLAFIGSIAHPFTKRFTVILSFIGNFVGRKGGFSFISLTAALSFIGNFTPSKSRLFNLVFNSVLRFRRDVTAGWKQFLAGVIISVTSLKQYVSGVNVFTKRVAEISQQEQTVHPTPALILLGDSDHLSGRPLPALFIKNLSTTTAVMVDCSSSFDQFPQLILPQMGILLSPDIGIHLYGRTTNSSTANIQVIIGG